jgi:hypothetical protein
MAEKGVFKGEIGTFSKIAVMAGACILALSGCSRELTEASWEVGVECPIDAAVEIKEVRDFVTDGVVVVECGSDSGETSAPTSLELVAGEGGTTVNDLGTAELEVVTIKAEHTKDGGRFNPGQNPEVTFKVDDVLGTGEIRFKDIIAITSVSAE